MNVSEYNVSMDGLVESCSLNCTIEAKSDDFTIQSRVEKRLSLSATEDELEPLKPSFT